jgi:uncharacterized RDD family membrane protein YckC
MKPLREHVVVTPEHVEVRLRPAGAGSRFVALLTDALMVFAVSSALTALTAWMLPDAIDDAVWATTSFVLSWGWHVYFELRHQGRSPGKRLCGLRVVDARGLPLEAGQSLVRNVARVLDGMPVFYALGALVSHLDPLRRRLGDLAADTLVIQERGADVAAMPGRTPPEWNSLHTSQVLRLIRRRVSPEEREFLVALQLRAPGLEPAARFDLMEEVAAFYRTRLEIDDPRLSGENLVRGLVAVVHAPRVSAARPGRRTA